VPAYFWRLERVAILFIAFWEAYFASGAMQCA
jgi:hypothetical protein